MARTTIRKRAAARKPVAKRASAARKTPASLDLKAIRDKQTKTQIIGQIAEDTGLTRKQVDSVLGSLSTLAKRHVMKRGSGEFAIPDMGLKVRRVHRKARMARNPATGDSVRVPAKTVVKATVLKGLKEALA